MNKEQYLKQRETLTNKAQTLLAEDKAEDANKVMDEIGELDTKFENHSTSMANLEALKNKVQIDNKIIAPVALGEENIVDDGKVYVNAWAKSMLNKAMDTQELEIFNKINNAAETTKDNQILIPETVVKGIWREAGELYPMLGDVAETYVTGGLTINKEVETVDTDDWYDEDTPVEDGDIDFAEVNLTGCELAKAITVSWKLRNMSIDEFIPYIQTKLAERMGKALAKAILKGKGHAGSGDSHKDQPLGIVTSLKAEEGTQQVVTYTTLDYDTVTQIMSKIKKYSNGSFFYANNDTIWLGLAQIKDQNGRPIFVPDSATGGVGRLFGKLVKEDDSLGKDELLLGNISKGYAMNINEKTTLHRDEQMKKRQTEFMTYSIVDGTPITNKAFVFAEKKAAIQTKATTKTEK